MMMFGNENITEACTVYCEGPILNAVQLAQIYNDSKTFVDMPMRYNPNATLEAFYNLTDPSDPIELQNYLNEYFLPAGSDLNTWVPTDFTQNPAFLDTITDPDYQQWGADLNELWLILGREVNESVHQSPQRHSYVPRNYPMVVPGGRFRESYYWDSWWIVRGLLVCDMGTTAKYVINNLLDDISAFGFVPNGGRIYYLDRSQPPLLSEMIRSYYTYMVDTTGQTDDLSDFISFSYQSLMTEYAFWMSPQHGHCVDMPLSAESAPAYQLNRFYSNYTTPRPESYLADYDNAHASSQPLDEYYHQVRAGAETGWDFSSRWIRESGYDNYNITNIHTNEVVPADLNSIMYKFEQNLAYFATQLSGWASAAGNHTAASVYTAQAQTYTAAASLRSAAINLYLWDGLGKHWRDYNITSQRWTHFTQQDAVYLSYLPADSSVTSEPQHSNQPAGLGLEAYPPDPHVYYNYSTIAYWVPLWAGLRPSDGTSNDDIVDALQASGLLQPGGVLTTTINTGQQWDAPDAWPPEVMFTIEGLQNLNTHNSLNLAVRFCVRLILVRDTEYHPVPDIVRFL